MESFYHVTCSIEKFRATAVITMIILTSDVTSAGFFFNLSDVSNYAVFQVGKKETQPPKSAKIPLRNETKVIGSLQPLFTLLLSCSSWSTEYLSLFHRMTSSLRNCNEWTGAKLFLTKHHQYKHEDFLRADSQCLCKRRAMNKSFAIIYILILFLFFIYFNFYYLSSTQTFLKTINHKQRQVCVFYIYKKGD